MAEGIIQELVTKLAFEYDPEGLKKSQKGMAKFKKGLDKTKKGLSDFRSSPVRRGATK